MEKKKLVLFYDNLRNVHLGKDVFLAPYYMGKQLNCEVSIVYLKCEESLPASWRGVSLIPIGGYKWRWVNVLMYYLYLIKNARGIDYMMRFHLKRHTLLLVVLYKLINPKGRSYVKADINPQMITDDLHLGIFERMTHPVFRKLLDVISCESRIAYDKMLHSASAYFNYGEKVVLMQNGFDEELLSSLNLQERRLEEKENVMMTVGRLGTYQKNTEMLLSALDKVELKDWKFYLVGSVDKDFEIERKRLMDIHPKWKESLIWTGVITDKKELYNLYNKSKVFVLTSRFEGFAIVYAEAQRFKNYIISTSVDSAEDVVSNGRYGELVNIDDVNGLANAIKNVIEGKTNINVYENFNERMIFWSECVKGVVKAIEG